jgi:hypothetical protein
MRFYAVRAYALTLFVTMTFLMTGQLGARLVEKWDYDRLFKQADAVVICHAVSDDDHDGRPTDPRMKDEAAFQGRVTTFKVVSTLKGKVNGDSIKFIHYRIKDGTTFRGGGPLLVSFQTKEPKIDPSKVDVNTRGKPEYMLFLKSIKDDKYEPVTGHYDAVLSVREIFVPRSD